MPSVFLVRHFCHIRHAILSGAIYWQKREQNNAGFAGIPASYPILRMSVSERLRGRKISQMIPNLWMTRAYLYSLSSPNGIEFINTFLLFVSNHGNCKNDMFVCSYLPQRASRIVSNKIYDWKTFCAVISVTVISVTVLRDGYDILYTMDKLTSQKW